MVGVVIIFIWGPPQPTFDIEGTVLIIDGPREDAIKAKQRQQRKRHLICSRIGLGLIGVGFLLQLVATWVP
jgi:hypothetical protein